jgi:hypothetical protein
MMSQIHRTPLFYVTVKISSRWMEMCRLTLDNSYEEVTDADITCRIETIVGNSSWSND